MRDSTIYAQDVRRIEHKVEEFNDLDVVDFEDDSLLLAEAIKVILMPLWLDGATHPTEDGGRKS